MVVKHRPADCRERAIQGFRAHFSDGEWGDYCVAAMSKERCRALFYASASEWGSVMRCAAQSERVPSNLARVPSEIALRPRDARCYIRVTVRAPLKSVLKRVFCTVAPHMPGLTEAQRASTACPVSPGPLPCGGGTATGGGSENCDTSITTILQISSAEF